MLVLCFLCEQHIFYDPSLLQFFQLSRFLFFLVKILNHYGVHAILLDNKHQLQENTLRHYPHYAA